MPNWCTNRLEVYGPVDELQKFILTVVGEVSDRSAPLRFSATLPPPAGLSAEDDYNWRKKNWGTKWDLDFMTDVTASPDQITYCFDTADTPPLQWVQKTAEEWPALSFDLYYYELGNFFAGTLECRNGEPRKIAEYEQDFDVSEFCMDNFSFDISDILEQRQG